MIKDITLSSRSVRPGHPVQISVEGAAPIRIRVACFTNNPPPPRFQHCSECQIHTLKSGGVLTIIPAKDTWKNTDGRLVFEVEDSTGDRRTETIDVELDESAGSAPAQSFMGAP